MTFDPKVVIKLHRVVLPFCQENTLCKVHECSYTHWINAGKPEQACPALSLVCWGFFSVPIVFVMYPPSPPFLQPGVLPFAHSCTLLYRLFHIVCSKKYLLYYSIMLPNVAYYAYPLFHKGQILQLHWHIISIAT